jgi:uracil-DNA glycosylase family 4
VKAGGNPGECYYDNIVRCWLPKNRSPTVAEMRHCWEAHILPSLRELEEGFVLVPTGMAAVKFIIKKANMKKLGTINQIDLEEKR